MLTFFFAKRINFAKCTFSLGAACFRTIVVLAYRKCKQNIHVYVVTCYCSQLCAPLHWNVANYHN